MAHKRENKLKVPSDTPSLSLSLSCPICPGPDPTRIDPSPQPQQIKKPRSEKILHERDIITVAETNEPVAKRAVNRCSGCGKRVGLTGFRCRCGDLYCSQHRYSDRHVCSFDYKAAGREAIARENPVVRAAKIVKV